MELCKIASSLHSLGTRSERTLATCDRYDRSIVLRSRQSAVNVSGISNEVATQLIAVIAVIVYRWIDDHQIIFK